MGLGTLLVGATVVGAQAVRAQTTGGMYPPFIGQFAQKLGLDEQKVKTAFDELRKKRQNQMQAQLEERLTQAVTDGKLTDAQKQLILAKHKELQEKRQSDWANGQTLTPEERREKRRAQRTELETWASQNSIDMSYLFLGMGPKAGMRGGWHAF